MEATASATQPQTDRLAALYGELDQIHNELTLAWVDARRKAGDSPADESRLLAASEQVSAAMDLIDAFRKESVR